MKSQIPVLQVCLCELIYIISLLSSSLNSVSLFWWLVKTQRKDCSHYFSAPYVWPSLCVSLTCTPFHSVNTNWDTFGGSGSVGAETSNTSGNMIWQHDSYWFGSLNGPCVLLDRLFSSFCSYKYKFIARSLQQCHCYNLILLTFIWNLWAKILLYFMIIWPLMTQLACLMAKLQIVLNRIPHREIHVGGSRFNRGIKCLLSFVRRGFIKRHHVITGCTAGRSTGCVSAHALDQTRE